MAHIKQTPRHLSRALEHSKRSAFNARMSLPKSSSRNTKPTVYIVLSLPVKPQSGQNPTVNTIEGVYQSESEALDHLTEFIHESPPKNESAESFLGKNTPRAIAGVSKSPKDAGFQYAAKTGEQRLVWIAERAFSDGAVENRRMRRLTGDFGARDWRECGVAPKKVVAG